MQRYLRLAELNIGLKAVESLGDADLHCDAALARLLPLKDDGQLRRENLATGIGNIVEVREPPDVRVLGTDWIAFLKVLDGRGGNKGQAFRKWLQAEMADPRDGRDLLRAYIGSLREWVPAEQSPVNFLLGAGSSVLASVAAAALGPAADAVVGVAADAGTHLLERRGEGRTVSAILDDLLEEVLDRAGTRGGDALALRVPPEE